MIITEIPKANYCSFFCFLLTIDECIINVWGYTEILPMAFVLLFLICHLCPVHEQSADVLLLPVQ